MTEPITLYHVSYDMTDAIELFTPRLPAQSAFLEDGATPRVSLADSTNGCLLANPETWEKFNVITPHDRRHTHLTTERQVRLVRPDGRILTGVPFRLYAFRLDANDVIPPDALQERGLVPDALATGEHWVTHPVRPSAVYDNLLVGGCDRGGRQAYIWHPLDAEDLARLEPYDPYADLF